MATTTLFLAAFLAAADSHLGAAVIEIPDCMRDKMRLYEGEGLLVLGVSPDSPAEFAGLQALDVIVAVDGKPVGTRAELRRAYELRWVLRSAFTLTVLRRGEGRILTIYPPWWTPIPLEPPA